MTTPPLSEQIVTAAFEAGLNWHAQDRDDFTDAGKAERAVEPLLQAALAAARAEERARCVAVLEAEIAQTSSGLAGRVRVGALEDALLRVRGQ